MVLPNGSISAKVQVCQDCWHLSGVLDGLVIQVLRVSGLREEKPAFREQADILDDKSHYEQGGFTLVIECEDQ